MSKNECNKTRDIDNPYEIWQGPANFEWRVLKKYQSPENEAKNEYARWFCAVKSDMTYGSFELGDTYVADIKAYGTKVKQSPDLGILEPNQRPYRQMFRLTLWFRSERTPDPDTQTPLEDTVSS